MPFAFILRTVSLLCAFPKTFSPPWPFQRTPAAHGMATSGTLKYCVRVKLLPEAACHILHHHSYKNKYLSSDLGENTCFISWLKSYSKYSIPSLCAWSLLIIYDGSGTAHLIVNSRDGFTSVWFQGYFEDVCIVHDADLFYVFSTHLGGSGSLSITQ